MRSSKSVNHFRTGRISGRPSNQNRDQNGSILNWSNIWSLQRPDIRPVQNRSVLVAILVAGATRYSTSSEVVDTFARAHYFPCWLISQYGK